MVSCGGEQLKQADEGGVRMIYMHGRVWKRDSLIGKLDFQGLPPGGLGIFSVRQPMR